MTVDASRSVCAAKCGDGEYLAGHLDMEADAAAGFVPVGRATAGPPMVWLR